jgi:hypothetical protein
LFQRLLVFVLLLTSSIAFVVVVAIAPCASCIMCLSIHAGINVPVLLVDEVCSTASTSFHPFRPSFNVIHRRNRWLAMCYQWDLSWRAKSGAREHFWGMVMRMMPLVGVDQRMASSSSSSMILRGAAIYAK